MRRALCTAVALVAVGLGGCGSTAPSRAPTTTRPLASPVTTTVPGPSTEPGTSPVATTLPSTSLVTTTVPSPAGVTITNATLGDAARGGVSLRVGAVLDVDLTSDAYTRSGVLAPWPVSLQPAPPGLAPALVAAAAPPACPSAASCHRFRGATAGHAEIVISGPAGILCDKAGAHCIGVSAVVAHVPVTVTG